MKGFLFLLFLLPCFTGFSHTTASGKGSSLTPPPSPPIVGDTMFFDLTNAVTTVAGSVTYYDIPVYIKSVHAINSFDFWFHFNQSELTYTSTISVIGQLDTYSYFNANNQFLSNTTSGPSIAYTIPNNSTLVYVRFQLASACTVVEPSDFWTTTALLNGEVSNYSFLYGQTADISGDADTTCTATALDFTFPSSYGGSNVTTYGWNFSNGSSSDQQTASVTFFDPDIYDVILDVQTANGCTYQFTSQVVVNQAPYVFFDATYSQDSIYCNNTSSPADYSWTFGDGATSTVQNPVHYFGNGGDYSVVLTSTTPDGCSGTYAAFITIDKPRAAFSAHDGCVGTAIPFDDLSAYPPGSVVAWNWNFGDGFTSTVQEPVHNFAVGGNYTVTLEAYSNLGTFGTYTQVVAVGNQPIVQFVATPLTACAPVNVNFSNTTVADSGSVYEWTFGDAGSSSILVPSHTYSTGGTYDVQLIVTTLQGCSDTLLKPAYIHAKEVPLADFSATGACLGEEIDFEDASTTSGSIVSWEWDFAGQGVAFTPTASQNFATAGTYTVSLQVTNDEGCHAVATQAIIVNAKPNIAFSSADLSGCSPLEATFLNQTTQDAGATYEWHFGDGGTSDAEHPTHTYTQNGDLDVELVVTVPGGCSDSLTLSDYINVFSGVTADFSDTNRCALLATEFFDETVLSSGSVSSWNWSFGDGNSSAAENPTYVYDNAGVYQVTLTIESDLGCSGSVTRFIEVDAAPDVQFLTVDPLGCIPFDVTFQNLTIAETGATYSWYFGDGGTDSDQQGSHTYTAMGDYDVTLVVTSSEGCRNSLTLVDYISLGTYPEAGFTFSDSVVLIPQATVSFTNTSFTYDFLNWDFGDDFYSDLVHPQHEYVDTGLMVVCLTAITDYGCADTVCHELFVGNSNPVALPGGFSPNGDASNDLFMVEGGPFVSIQFRVYNEWGNILFESTDQADGWDGTYQGTPQPSGSYEYTVTGTTLDNLPVNIYGSVQLIR